MSGQEAVLSESGLDDLRADLDRIRTEVVKAMYCADSLKRPSHAGKPEMFCIANNLTDSIKRLDGLRDRFYPSGSA